MINAENVSFKYNSSENGSMVLDGVNLKINPGEFVAVLGHNGSGKSTLAKHFNAILLPSEGKVTVDGIDTSYENSYDSLLENVLSITIK